MKLEFCSGVANEARDSEYVISSTVNLHFIHTVDAAASEVDFPIVLHFDRLGRKKFCHNQPLSIIAHIFFKIIIIFSIRSFLFVESKHNLTCKYLSESDKRDRVWPTSGSCSFSLCPKPNRDGHSFKLNLCHAIVVTMVTWCDGHLVNDCQKALPYIDTST